MPDETWLNLSSELEHYAGVFVLGGLPNNSFQEFSRKLAKLKQKGMSAAVLIDPNLFREYHIQNSPTFVFTDGSKVHKIVGNISLKYALEYTNLDLENYEHSRQVAEKE
jgi:type-F conjugative transfer system pilin assembly protein TrbC